MGSLEDDFAWMNQPSSSTLMAGMSLGHADLSVSPTHSSHLPVYVNVMQPAHPSMVELGVSPLLNPSYHPLLQNDMGALASYQSLGDPVRITLPSYGAPHAALSKTVGSYPGLLLQQGGAGLIGGGSGSGLYSDMIMRGPLSLVTAPQVSVAPAAMQSNSSPLRQPHLNSQTLLGVGLPAPLPVEHMYVKQELRAGWAPQLNNTASVFPGWNGVISITDPSLDPAVHRSPCHSPVPLAAHQLGLQQPLACVPGPRGRAMEQVWKVGAEPEGVSPVPGAWRAFSTSPVRSHQSPVVPITVAAAPSAPDHVWRAMSSSPVPSPVLPLHHYPIQQAAPPLPLTVGEHVWRSIANVPAQHMPQYQQRPLSAMSAHSGISMGRLGFRAGWFEEPGSVESEWAWSDEQSDGAVPSSRKLGLGGGSVDGTVSGGGGSRRGGKGKTSERYTSEQQRIERNAREKKRSLRISQQIDSLRRAMEADGLRVEGCKYTLLSSVVDYITKLQERTEVLAKEKTLWHKKEIECGSSPSKSSNSSSGSSSTGGGGSGSGAKGKKGKSGSGKNSKAVVTVSAPNTAAATALSDSSFRDLFLQSLLAIAVADSFGMIVDCNPAFERLSGFGREELRQQSLFSLSANPADMPDGMRALLRGEPVTSPATTASSATRGLKAGDSFEWAAKRKSGECDLVFTVASSLDSRGGWTYLHCVLRPASSPLPPTPPPLPLPQALPMKSDGHLRSGHTDERPITLVGCKRPLSFHGSPSATSAAVGSVMQCSKVPRVDTSALTASSIQH